MPDRDSPQARKRGGPYKLELPDDVLDQLEITLCNRVNSAVGGAADRNSDLRRWRDQLEGFGVTAQNENWENACNLSSPLSMKSFLTILSQLHSALNHDPAVEAFTKDDDEGARLLESWLAMARSRYQVDGPMHDLAHNACRDPATVGYVGWNQITRRRREVGYKRNGSALVIPEESKEEGVEYEEVPISEEVVEERYDIRAIDLSDFYLYPPTIGKIEDATLVCERMYVTSDALWDGIEDYGYDRDSVERLVAMGPPPTDDDRREDDAEIAGLVDEGDRDGGMYEIFTCYTRLPRSLPGMDDGIPDYLLQDDFLVVCCPSLLTVLKIVFSPFKERPYFCGGILPKPDKIQGYGLMGMLEGMQSEANANVQLSIDSSNLVVAPMVIVEASEHEDIVKQKTGPGAVIKVKDPKAVAPWPINTNPTRDGLTWQQWIDNQAQGIVSAEGQGSYQPKVRKAAEVQATEMASSAKFSMYLENFQRTVTSEVYRRMIALKLQFGDVDEDGEDFVDPEGHARKLTARALRGKFNVVATGTSLTHSPEARIDVAKQIQAIQGPYVQAAMGGMPAKFLKLLWHSSRELIMDLGKRNPEMYIGDEPEEQPQQPQQQGQQGQQPPQNGQTGGGQPPQNFDLSKLGANN